MYLRPINYLTLHRLALFTAALVPAETLGLFRLSTCLDGCSLLFLHPGQPPKNVLSAALTHYDRYRETFRVKTDDLFTVTLCVVINRAWPLCRTPNVRTPISLNLGTLYVKLFLKTFWEESICARLIWIGVNLTILF